MSFRLTCNVTVVLLGLLRLIGNSNMPPSVVCASLTVSDGIASKIVTTPVPSLIVTLVLVLVNVPNVNVKLSVNSP
jgi:hypothetical protein